MGCDGTTWRSRRAKCNSFLSFILVILASCGGASRDADTTASSVAPSSTPISTSTTYLSTTSSTASALRGTAHRVTDRDGWTYEFLIASAGPTVNPGASCVGTTPPGRTN